MKGAENYLWRVLLAAALLFGISFVSFRVLARFQEFPPPPGSYAVFVCSLLVSSLLVAAVLTYPTVRSRWSGTQLMVAIFVAYFGVHTLVNLSRAVLIMPKVMTFPRAALLTAHGFLVAVLFSFVLVLLMGRLPQQAFVAESSRLHLPPGEWLWKLAVSTIICVGLYLAGQTLAQPYLSEFHRQVGVAPQWQRLILQTGRALMLVGFVLPVIKMTTGGRWEAALTTASLLCVLGTVAPLLPPNPFLPRSVRLALLVEGGVTSFIYGLLVGYLFSRRPGGV